MHDFLHISAFMMLLCILDQHVDTLCATHSAILALRTLAGSI